MNARKLSTRVKVLALSSVLGAGVLCVGAGAASAAPRVGYRYPVNRWVNDFDRDGIPNRWDRDIDNDRIPNVRDRNDYSPLRRARDWDRDGVRNRRDLDRDGDGVRNRRDRRPNNGRRA